MADNVIDGEARVQRPPQSHREVARLVYRQSEPRTIFVSPAAPCEIKAALTSSRTWDKTKFDVKALIGKTQVVWVYDAVCKLSGVVCALKCYRKETQSRINYQQIEREMNVQALLNHHNVLKMYGAFEDATFIYLVQQLARKGDVYKTYLQHRIQLSERDIVVRIIGPLLRALDHAHSRGVIHRDIKPENVFLSESEEVLLGDWGLGIDNVQERPVSRVGTLDYMAPEVLRAPSIPPGQNFRAYSKELGSYDSTVDVYAVGAIAYEFIHGRPPFYRRDRSEKKALILKGHLPFSTAFSDDAKDFIAQAMHAVPAQRGSAAQLLRHPWVTKQTSSKQERAVEAAAQRPNNAAPRSQTQPTVDMQERLVKEVSHHKNSPVSSLWHQQLPPGHEGSLQGSGRKDMSMVSSNEARVAVAGSPLGMDNKSKVGAVGGNI